VTTVKQSDVQHPALALAAIYARVARRVWLHLSTSLLSYEHRIHDNFSTGSFFDAVQKRAEEPPEDLTTALS
jgi:hypothetical protein